MPNVTDVGEARFIEVRPAVEFGFLEEIESEGLIPIDAVLVVLRDSEPVMFLTLEAARIKIYDERGFRCATNV